MKIRELAVRDAFRITPTLLPDHRGYFFELFQDAELAAAVGHPFRLAQSNNSVSRRGTIRGVHSVTIPPGQAKFVTCVRGAVLDMVVDLRLGSPTFGRHAAAVLDEQTHDAVYIPEGIGHAFQALTEGASVTYLCSTRYQPGTPFEVSPLDPELELPWDRTLEPILSDKDVVAPTLAEAERIGMLPTYDECRRLYATPAGPALAEPAR